MNNKIVIEGISAKGLHGVLQIEKEKKQKFLVDVELNLNLDHYKYPIYIKPDYQAFQLSSIKEHHI